MKNLIVIIFIASINYLFADIFLGKIYNSHKKPISDVIIYHQNKITISDKNGNFIIKDVALSDTLTFHKIGYNDKKILAKFLLKNKIILMKIKPFLRKPFKVIGKESSVLPNLSNKLTIKANENDDGSAVDIIKNISSINVSGIKLSGEEQNISILGHHGRHTLIMIDGVAQNQDGKAYDLSQIPSEIIQSIEIITDNAGADGGTGAIAGIININTKKTFGTNSLMFSKKFGSFGLNKNDYSYSFGIKHFNGLVYLGKTFSKNNFTYKQRIENHYEKVKRNNNEKEMYNFSSKINYHFQNFNLGYTILVNQFTKYLPGNSEMLLLYENSHLDGFDINQRIDSNYSLEKYSFQTSFYENKKHSSYKNLLAPISVYKSYGISNYEIYGFIGKIKSSYDFPLNFENGIDYKNQIYKYDDVYFGISNLPKTSQDNIGYFSKLKLSFSSFPLSNKTHLSLRYDKNEVFNDFFSYRISSQISLHSLFEIVVGGNIGNAQSLPSFYNLYWKGDAQASGNPDLIPEESKGYELFSSIKYDFFNLKLSYHKNDVKNLIYWFRSFNGSWKPDNLVNAEYQNFVSFLDIRFSKKLNFTGNYTRTIALDKSKNPNGTESQFWNKNIIYTPTYKQNYSLNYHNNFMSAKFEYEHIGKQWITRDNIHNPIADYEIFSIENSFKKEYKPIEISADMDFNNILNKEYEIYNHTPQPGFNWSIGLKIKIKM